MQIRGNAIRGGIKDRTAYHVNGGPERRGGGLGVPGSGCQLLYWSHMSTPTPKITPFLWFDHEAEEAARFYTSIFKNSKIETVTRYGEAGPGPKGSVMTAAFELDGQKFVALNGGPHFKFTGAISFVVNCETQQEVDDF